MAKRSATVSWKVYYLSTKKWKISPFYEGVLVPTIPGSSSINLLQLEEELETTTHLYPTSDKFQMNSIDVNKISIHQKLMNFVPMSFCWSVSSIINLLSSKKVNESTKYVKSFNKF